MRKQFVVTNTVTRGRGRGAVGHGKAPRYSNSGYDAEPRPFQESRSMQFTTANRGRAKRLDRVVQYSNSGNSAIEDDMRELNEQLAATDLNKRSINLRLGKGELVLSSSIVSPSMSHCKADRWVILICSLSCGISMLDMLKNYSNRNIPFAQPSNLEFTVGH